MSTLSPRRYLALLLRQARTNLFSKWRVVSSLAALAASAVLWFFPLSDAFRDLQSLGVASIALVGLFAFRLLLQAPYELVGARDEVIRTLESERDRYKAALTDHQKHEEVSRELMILHTQANEKLLRKVEGRSDGDDLWMLEALDWQEAVFDVLRRNGYTEDELAALKSINSYDRGAFAGTGREVADVSVFMLRVGQLAERHRLKADSYKLRPS